MPFSALIAAVISSTTGADLKSWCHPPLTRADDRDHDGHMSRMALSAHSMPLRKRAPEEVKGTMTRCVRLPTSSVPVTTKGVTTCPATHISLVASTVVMATGDGRVRDGRVVWTGARAERIWA